MKLTIEKPKLGYTHVRGGRVLSVLHGHQVATTTNKWDPTHRKQETEYVTCKPGDLAVEIVLVKTGKVIGYAYVSGDALQYMRYGMETGLRPELFEPVIAWRVNLQPTGEIDGMKMIHAIQRCKYAPDGVRAVVFDLLLEEGDGHATAQCGRFITEVYRLNPLPGSPIGIELANSPGKSHLFGMIRAGVGDGATTIHFQPPDETHKHGCAPFQINLMWSSPCLVDHDVLKEHE